MAADRPTVVGTGRLEAFSDGVFAIAITLLALQLELPAGFPGDPTDRQLIDALVAEAPTYFTFVLSFFVIGKYWIAHHNLFRHIQRSTGGLLTLNLLLLLSVVALPFPTEVLGEHGDLPAAAVFYAASISLVGIFMALLWRYAVTRRLLKPGLSPAVVRRTYLRSLMVPVVFLLSIPVTLVSVTAAELFWILTFVTSSKIR